MNSNYNYNYNKKKFWVNDIKLNKYNEKLNPYILLNIVKDQYKKINNNKFFYLEDIDSYLIKFRLINILLVSSNNINIQKKIEYSNFLIIYLLKNLSFQNFTNTNIILKILLKIFYFIKPYKFKKIHKKQAYNFCKYNYKCKSYYEKKNCKFDHYSYHKICIDIQYIIDNKIYLDILNLKKYIVTLHYVIEHIYDEYFMYRYIKDI